MGRNRIFKLDTKKNELIQKSADVSPTLDVSHGKVYPKDSFSEKVIF